MRQFDGLCGKSLVKYSATRYFAPAKMVSNIVGGFCMLAIGGFSSPRTVTSGPGVAVSGSVVSGSGTIGVGLS